jgi:predicted RNA methylase
VIEPTATTATEEGTPNHERPGSSQFCSWRRRNQSDLVPDPLGLTEKIMNVSPEVLSELAELVIVDRTACITRQLDRKLYLKVNEVLVACGGKWDRKAKAHVFAADAQPLIELVLSTGDVQTSADLGFFPTPAPLAKRLVEMAGVAPHEHVLEPSAGEGAIAYAILNAGASVTCIERYFMRHAAIVKATAPLAHKCLDLNIECSILDVDDFMHYESNEPFDRVAMNPPFCKVGQGDHIDHVRHAFEMLRGGGVLVSVLPAGIMFREDRRHREFRAWILAHGTLADLPDDSFKESGTRVRTCIARMVR